MIREEAFDPIRRELNGHKFTDPNLMHEGSMETWANMCQRGSKSVKKNLFNDGLLKKQYNRRHVDQ